MDRAEWPPVLADECVIIYMVARPCSVYRPGRAVFSGMDMPGRERRLPLESRLLLPRPCKDLSVVGLHVQPDQDRCRRMQPECSKEAHRSSSPRGTVVLEKADLVSGCSSAKSAAGAEKGSWKVTRRREGLSPGGPACDRQFDYRPCQLLDFRCRYKGKRTCTIEQEVGSTRPVSSAMGRQLYTASGESFKGLRGGEAGGVDGSAGSRTTAVPMSGTIACEEKLWKICITTAVCRSNSAA